MKKKDFKFLTCMSLVILLLLTNVQMAYANTNYAENAATWFKEQAFWLGVIAIIIALVLAIWKRSWTSVIIIVLGGGVVLYFINNPEKIKSIGESIAKVIAP